MRHQPLLNFLIGILGIAVLAIAFYGYLRPGFIIDIANRIFLCL